MVNKATAEASLKSGWRGFLTAYEGKPIDRAKTSDKCKHEEIVILSQLEWHTLHLPVFLNFAT
jgi:hypothetical protein